MFWNLFARKPQSHTTKRDRKTQRSFFELLEDRVVPATYSCCFGVETPEPARVSGVVWYDLNADGVRDEGEPGIPDATVKLTWLGCDGIESCDDVDFFATTDGEGNYRICELPTGEYLAEVCHQPNGLTTPTTSVTNFCLFEDRAIDFGFTGSGSIGDRVHYDFAGCEVDEGGPGIAGVSVELTWYGFDGEADTCDDITWTTTTCKNGEYSFSNLAYGDYRVSIDACTLPKGLVPTYDLDSGDCHPDNTTEVTLCCCSPYIDDADFGYAGTGSIGDIVWLDFNGDGVLDCDEPGLADVELQLTWAGPDGDLCTRKDNVTLYTTTDEYGYYSFEGLPAGVYQVEVVCGLPDGVTNTGDPDGDFDGETILKLKAGRTRCDINFGYQGGSSLAGFVYRDLNEDGEYQTSSETGIEGVEVSLVGIDVAGNYVVRTTATAADGSYSFAGLLAGYYAIIETQPPSVEDAGQEGYYDGLDTPGSLGGCSPVKNVIVTWLCSTDIGTDYNFGEVPPTSLISTLAPTIPETTDTPAASIAPDTTLGGRQLSIALGSVDFTSLLNPSSPTFLPIAASFNPPTSTVEFLLQLAALGGGEDEERPGEMAGFVFHDRNQNGQRDESEGLAGIPVRLAGTDSGGTKVERTAVTDKDGGYQFSGLRPGRYNLTVEMGGDHKSAAVNFDVQGDQYNFAVESLETPPQTQPKTSPEPEQGAKQDESDDYFVQLGQAQSWAHGGLAVLTASVALLTVETRRNPQRRKVQPRL